MSYDDENLIEEKIKYAYKKGLGGLMIWAIDQETEK
jgi:chitinase